MDSCLRRIFLEALGADLAFIDRRDEAIEAEMEPIGISEWHLPGMGAYLYAYHRAHLHVR